MTNEELDEARGNEAYELWCRDQPDGTKGYAPVQVAIRAARLAREGWTPPEPVVDPDILAFREWGERRFGVNTASAYRLGDCDDTAIADAYLAGARMARERERERAKVLVEFVGGVTTLGSNDSISAIVGVARFTLAKYRGEA
jgi:hypothetical protein